jgi:uncharacterized protein YpuA (DUF1002 family)
MQSSPVQVEHNHKYKIEKAELELKQVVNSSPASNTLTVDRLKGDLEKLKAELKKLIAKENDGASEHDKGA